MKRGLFLISLLLLIISPVFAKDNRLYFTETNNRLYYESGMFDESIFMKHTDMIPGSSYTDELKIENGTNTKYKLYFKAAPKSNDSEVIELLENTEMIISIDGIIIYSGNALGDEFDGINLKEAICLGDIKPKQNSTMKVETKLLETYSNTNNLSTSEVDWVFYASYDNSEPDIINPNTFAQGTNYNTTLLWIILGIVVLLIVWFKLKEKSHRTKSKKLLQKR